MWGAIIQAIDHALGRMNEGASAGIKVANSQSGGGAPISKMDSGAGEAVSQKIADQGTSAEQNEAAEKAKIGSNSTATGEVPSGGQAKGGAGVLGNVGNIGDIGSIGGEGAEGAVSEGAAEGAAEAASNIVSDENAKSAKPVSKDEKDTVSKTDKLQGLRAYGAGVGKGFANAGAIATGNKAAEWEDIETNDLAKKAAEDTVKNWHKRDAEPSKSEIVKEEK